MVLLPNNFLLLVALRSNSRVHHDLGILFLELVPKALWKQCGVKFSAFFVLRSVGAATLCRSRMALKKEMSENIFQTSACPSQESQRTSAPVRSRESGSSSRSTVSKGLLNLLVFCLEDSGANTNNCHRALDRNNFNLQPFATFPFLLDFARISLPIKHIFSCSKIGRNKLHPSSKISADIFSLLYFKVSSHGQFLNFFIEKSCLVGVDVRCSGFVEAGSRRSLGLRPMANSIGVVPLKVIWVFLTVAALRIK